MACTRSITPDGIIMKPEEWNPTSPIGKCGGGELVMKWRAEEQGYNIRLREHVTWGSGIRIHPCLSSTHTDVEVEQGFFCRLLRYNGDVVRIACHHRASIVRDRPDRLKEAKRYLDKYKRLDAAIDAFFQDAGRRESTASPSKLLSLFDRYKDPDGDIISTQGTVQFLTDLGFKQDEDEVDDTPKLLSLAFELQSPRLGEWSRKGWLDGWKNIGCDTIDAMKTALTRLEAKLGSDPSYFRTVYNYTFNFARTEGQRSLAKDTALEYWQSLLRFGVGKEALRYTSSEDEEDVDMDRGQGWTEEHTEMWLTFMKLRDDVAVSKDTWQMLPDFIRSFDGDFGKHDDQAAWPTIIDQFVEWAKGKTSTT